jgi:histone H3/H4
MAKKSGGESLVVQSKVKAYIKKNKMKCSSDVVSGLTKVIANTLNKACERAKANGRKTLRSADL